MWPFYYASLRFTLWTGSRNFWMISQAVQETIKSAIGTGEFGPLYEYFADDVELNMAMSVWPSVSDERCKQAVVDARSCSMSTTA